MATLVRLSALLGTVKQGPAWMGPVILLLLGTIFGLIGFFWLKKVRAAKRWPSATGHVIHCSVVSQERNDRDSSSGVTIRIGPKPRDYSVSIEYEFEAGGNTFRGTRLAFARRLWPHEGPARAIVAKHPPGSTVTVFYDPDKPSEAVLDRSGLGGGALFLGIGLLMFALGLAIAVHMLRAK